jgi:Flp pilus assembly protein TadG
MEFALVAIPFFFITFATFDLGRYFLTQHSLRTLTSELARATLVFCAGQSQTSQCNLPATGTQSVASAEAKVPFLAPASFASTPSAARSAADQNTGQMTITASVSYNFSFLLPFWSSLSGPLSETTQLTY